MSIESKDIKILDYEGASFTMAEHLSSEKIMINVVDILHETISESFGDMSKKITLRKDLCRELSKYSTQYKQHHNDILYTALEDNGNPVDVDIITMANEKQQYAIIIARQKQERPVKGGKKESKAAMFINKVKKMLGF